MQKEELLSEVARQTREIDFHREQVKTLGQERRELFTALRNLGVTYKQLAAATGLHQVTIQQNMGRFRKQMVDNEESCADTDSNDSTTDAVVASA